MKGIFITMTIAMLSMSANATQYSTYGTVKMVRLHQYLTDQGWDKNIWFCLNNSEIKGNCGGTTACDGHMGLIIDKEAQPQLFSTILAARMAEKPVKVWIDDSFKMEGSSFCYAKIVDL